MTVTAIDLLLYALALLVLFLTPGPVWVALIARSLSGGFHGAWPLALGVVVGDALWPFLAILGANWFLGEFEGAMTLLRWTASAIFMGMGLLILRNADRSIAADSRLTRPGVAAGFLAGVAVILGNPKAILFYLGVLPGFFPLGEMTNADIAMVVAISAVVPLLGNLSLALFVQRVRRVLASPRAMRRSNQAAGVMLIAVAVMIPVV